MVFTYLALLNLPNLRFCMRQRQAAFGLEVWLATCSINGESLRADSIPLQARRGNRLFLGNYPYNRFLLDRTQTALEFPVSARPFISRRTRAAQRGLPHQGVGDSRHAGMGTGSVCLQPTIEFSRDFGVAACFPYKKLFLLIPRTLLSRT